MKRVFTIITLLAATATIAGCMPKQSQWAGNETAMRNTVDLVRVPHEVSFDSDAATLSDAEAAKLDAFLARINVGNYDRLFIDLPEGEEEAPTAADKERGDAVAAHLESLGHDVYAAPMPYGAVPENGTVRIVVERYVVTPPTCPDWRQPASPNYENAPSSNWGCATTAALGLMVANPRDLVEGREMGTQDAGVAAAAVRRYRTDEVKWGKGKGGDDISTGLIEND